MEGTNGDDQPIRMRELPTGDGQPSGNTAKCYVCPVDITSPCLRCQLIGATDCVLRVMLTPEGMMLAHRHCVEAIAARVVRSDWREE